MSRVVLIGADAVLERQSRRLLGDEVVVLAPASSDVLVSELLWLDRRPELVILGAAMPPVLALWIARSVRDLADTIALVSDDTELYEQSRASGVTEFLGTEVDLEELDALFTRARELAALAGNSAIPPRRTAPARPGAVVAVMSPKGGVGKTTVAANLAAALARDAGARVVLVDLDLQFGDVATVLGLTRRHSIADALSKAAARDSFVLGTFLMQHECGIAVLAAPASPVAADHLDADRVGHMLRQLVADFDYVVVDAAPGLDEPALAAIEQASALVAVTGLDVRSARGLRSCLEVLRELRLEPAVRGVVVNRIGPVAGIEVPDLERIAAVTVDAVVPSRKAVALAANQGVPVVESAPRDPASRVLRAVAKRLHTRLTEREPAAAPVAAPRRPRVKEVAR